jgi:PKD repeat protein
MKHSALLFAVLSLLLITIIIAPVHACINTADFSATPRNVRINSIVSFLNLSVYTCGGDIDDWGWIFGDGSSYNATSPGDTPHTYTVGGYYEVSLSTFKSGSFLASEFKPMYISVSTVTSSFTWACNATTPYAVDFTDTSSASNNYPPLASAYWDFGDGNTSAMFNQTNVYPNASISYLVIHTVTDNNPLGGVSHTTSTGITPCAPGSAPGASFTAAPLTGPTPLLVQFTDTSANLPTSWSWCFGDGTSSPDQSPLHMYGSAGTYTVNLTATNAHGSDYELKVGYIVVGSGGGGGGGGGDSGSGASSSGCPGSTCRARRPGSASGCVCTRTRAGSREFPHGVRWHEFQRRRPEFP